jgi:hypothetical protein
MNYAEVNGVRVVSGVVTLPATGIWHCDLMLALPTPITGALAITIGNLALVGSSLRDVSYAGSRAMRIIGGAGGWRSIVAAKSYQQDAGVKLSLILNDAASDAGEKVSILTDSVYGPAFERFNSPASDVLNLCAPGWWMNLAGVVVVGARASAPITTKFDVTNFAGFDGKTQVATEDLASWIPGNTFAAPTLPAAQTISSVVHTFDDSGKARTEVLAA